MKSNLRGQLWVLLPLALVLFGVASSTDLPGLYLDSVNPDYLTLKLLAASPYEPPAWIVPGNYLLGQFPLMVQVYHGALPFWLGLPFYALFGTDVVGVRITHAFFASMVVLAAWWMLTRMGARKPLAAVLLAAMATDPAFQFAFRTQFYITTLPVALLFASIAIAWPDLTSSGRHRSIVLYASGVVAGLAIYGYFHFVFFVAILGLYIWVAGRGRGGFLPWSMGVLTGVSPILLGWLLMSVSVGSATALLDQAQTLGAFGADSDLFSRANGIAELWRLAFSGQGANLMMLGTEVAFRHDLFKVVVLLALPAVSVLAVEVTHNSSSSVRLLVLLTLVPVIAYGFLFGGRLWVQHFVVIVPLVYCLAVLTYGLWLKSSRHTRVAKGAVISVSMLLLLFNANNSREVLYRLESTGGIGFFSNAIDAFARQARGDPALYVLPDWGLALPFVMTTRGETQVDTSFDPETIERTLCSGRDVVVASIGPGADMRSDERASAIQVTRAKTETFDQRAGAPVIYTLRWEASEAVACP